MSEKSFKNYVKFKDLGIDPKEGLAGDKYNGPLGYKDKPEKGTGPAAGEPLPYSNPEEEGIKTGQVLVARDSNPNKKPLGEEETQGMGNASSVLKKSKPNVKETAPYKKLTNEEFINKPVAELIKSLSEDCSSLATVSDLFGNQYTPEPNQAINYVVNIAASSPRMMDRLVMAMKGQGLMPNLVESLMQHQQCYDCLVDAMGHGETGKSHSHQFANAMHDKYSNAISIFEEGVDSSPDERFSYDRRENSGSVEPFSNVSSVGGAGMPNSGGSGMPNPTNGYQPNQSAKSQFKPLKSPSAAGHLFECSASFPLLKEVMNHHCGIQ